MPHPTPSSAARWRERFHNRQTAIVAHHYPDRTNDELRHDHDFLEIQLCAGGTGRQQSAIGDIPFTRGDVMLLRPGAWHFHHGNDHVNAYVCCFGASFLQHELLWMIDDPALNQLLWRPARQDESGISVLHLDEAELRECVQALDALTSLGENDDPAQRPARIAHLILVLACLSRNLLRRLPAADETAKPVHIAVKRCLKMLDENMADPWTASLMAELLHVDVSYLGRLFSRALGTTPMQYLARIRAERAAQLLLRDNRPVAEIAEAVGWPNPDHFARRFRLHFGISATEYRDRYRRHRSASS